LADGNTKKILYRHDPVDVPTTLAGKTLVEPHHEVIRVGGRVPTAVMPHSDGTSKK
jgi:hypothetical protein